MKKLTWLILVCLMAGMFAALPAMAEAEVDHLQNIPYIDDGREEHMLDVHGYDGTVKPTIVEVHGGGYIGGSKEVNTEHSQFYADNGFLVVNTNYVRLPEGNFKTVAQDLFAVLHWVEDHAEEYGFDLNNVFMSGDSAGGYFVNLMAVLLNTDAAREYFDVALPSFQVKGFALTCPGTDLMAMRDVLGQPGPAGYTAGRVGEEILMDDDLMSHCDLYSIIDPATFPKIYFLTTPTDAVLYEEAVKYDAFLTEQGIDHVYKVYEGEENELAHVFNINKMDYAESKKANQDIVDYLKGLCE